ncbi:MAG: 16S rRNA (cytosine(967)-C(5))-methyltransferase RsmB [Arenimonas sp.]
MNAAPGAELRALAARSLVSVLAQGQSLKAELARALPGIADPRDRALFEAICFSVLRHYRRYRFALDTWMERPLRERDIEVQCLLLAGLAQIDALKLSAHAAVGATAEAARVLGRSAQVGLVNAVLRRALREPWPESDDPAVKTSHPDWLLAALQRDWPQDWPSMLQANNVPAPMWLCVNPRRLPRVDYLAQLQAAGIDAEAPPQPAHALRAWPPRSPEALPGWKAGLLWVQDGAAQLAVEALAPALADAVLDACAAPGGKTAQLAAALGEGGSLLAMDIDPRRMRRVQATLQRLQLESPQITLAAGDATKPDCFAGERRFDAILLDAPCSATGIIRRQPDIKWHRRAEDIAPLVALQARLLDSLWTRLAPGGRLLYATCSVLKDENERQVEAFLARTPAARALPLDARFGHASGVGRQRLPGEEGMDGFFYALVTRDA